MADSADVRRAGLELLVTAAGLLPDATAAAVVARDALAAMDDPEMRSRVAVFLTLAALDRPDMPVWVAGLRVRVGAADERDALERMWAKS